MPREAPTPFSPSTSKARRSRARTGARFISTWTRSGSIASSTASTTSVSRSRTRRPSTPSKRRLRVNAPGSRRRLHLGEPCHDASEGNECAEGREGLFAAQGYSTEAFDPVEETFDEMAFLVDHPVDGRAATARRVLLDLCRRTQVAGDEATQGVGIIGGVGDHVANVGQPVDQPARLRAVAPL